MIYLASYLNYNNVLMVTERKKMTLDDLPKVLGVSGATTKRFWDKVNGRYVIQRDDGSLSLNGTLFRGKQKRISERLTKFYIDAVQKLYQATPASKHGCLGRVFQLLPYISIEFNFLCHNPAETDLSKIEPMKLQEFCAETGYDPSQAHRLVQDLSTVTFDVNGEQRHFVAFVTTNPASTDRMIVVNPRVLYGGHNYQRVEAFALFFRN